jgi:hypothetical protein
MTQKHQPTPEQIARQEAFEAALSMMVEAIRKWMEQKKAEQKVEGEQ